MHCARCLIKLTARGLCGGRGEISEIGVDKLGAIVKRIDEWEEAKHPRDEEGKFATGRRAQKVARVWNGKATVTHTTLNKAQTGAIGEKIAVDFLRNVQGLKDARPLHIKTSTHFPLDLVGDHEIFEVKTGVCSSSNTKWRVTLGQPGKAEAAWLRKASPAAKHAWNQRKAAEAMKRKQQVVKEFSRKTGRKLTGRTIGVIINPDAGAADVYAFDGFHAAIGWNSALAKQSYIGSYNYA